MITLATPLSETTSACYVLGASSSTKQSSLTVKGNGPLEARKARKRKQSGVVGEGEAQETDRQGQSVSGYG